MKYRHIVIRQFGGPEVLQVVEDDLAAPRSGQALVKVLAADVGFSDVNIRRGRYPGAPRPPFTPGYAMVGVVDQLSPGTAGLEPVLHGLDSYVCVTRRAAIPVCYRSNS
jgi:NADPH:quinone reductase-like Zn-dependent oxidoreductase